MKGENKKNFKVHKLQNTFIVAAVTVGTGFLYVLCIMCLMLYTLHIISLGGFRLVMDKFTG